MPLAVQMRVPCWGPWMFSPSGLMCGRDWQCCLRNLAKWIPAHLLPKADDSIFQNILTSYYSTVSVSFVYLVLPCSSPLAWAPSDPSHERVLKKFCDLQHCLKTRNLWFSATGWLSYASYSNLIKIETEQVCNNRMHMHIWTGDATESQLLALPSLSLVKAVLPVRQFSCLLWFNWGEHKRMSRWRHAVPR